MGKRSKEKKYRAKEQKATQSLPVVDGVSSMDSRRAFIKNTAWLGGGVLAGTAIYKLGKNKNEDEASSEYLSVNEAVQVYHNLQSAVTAKWKEAQREKKPLRIFVLENHNSVNAFAYELMLVDIADKLEIRTLLPELGRNSLQAIENAAPTELSQILNKKQILQSARKKNFKIENIDTLYTTQAEFNRAYQDLTKQFAEEELQKRYKVSNLVVTIIPSKDINSLVFEFKITGNFVPPLSSEEAAENGHILRRAREKAYAITHDERNEAMLATIKRFGNAIVITGKEHGLGLLPPLRETHEIDVAFTVSDKALQSDEQNGLLQDEEMKKRMQWANNPANAVQYTGKEFNPQNISAFVNRVIEKANTRGMSF